MKTKYLVILLGFLLLSCSDEQRKDLTASPQNNPAPQDTIHRTELYNPAPQDTIRRTQLSDEEIAAMQKKCEAYFESMSIPDSIRIAYIDEILAARDSQLTENNRKFLAQLRNELASYDPQNPSLAIEYSLFPVFKLKEGEIGVFGFPVPDMQRLEEYTDISAESKLLAKTAHKKGAAANLNKLVHYPHVLHALYPSGKPEIYLYTANSRKKSRIQDFGFSEGECSEYYHYTFDTQVLHTADQVLFASRLPIDLTYENNPEFDAWYRSGLVPECADCPSSHHLSKSFAKLKGTDNMYFMYADTFPLNNELDTPLRALIAKGKDNKWLYLWYSDIDNFGCSCL